MNQFSISGKIVDLFNNTICGGEVIIAKGKILQIIKREDVPNVFIMPGLIDAHVHVESSMLTPSRFARLVVPRGTIGVVSDPHEIANVLGEAGVLFMIEDGKKTPFKFFFGAPSCVPATSFEASGAVLDVKAIEKLLQNPDVYFLSEMMNFPGVIAGDVEVIGKIEAAKNLNMKIDGHAPGLIGEALIKYIGAGIETDHECATIEEALEKISLGMKIQIREGSAARNFKNLAPLFDLYPNSIMLCTDDSHPDEILNHGHIDKLIKLGLDYGIDVFKLLRAATINPVQHYNLPVGLLREGDTADFIVVDSLSNFEVQQSYINGECVYDHLSGIQFPLNEVIAINAFRTEKISLGELKVTLPNDKSKVKVIEVEDGELLTSAGSWSPKLDVGREVCSDSTADVLKLVVVNRYEAAIPSIGFVRNFGFKHGALASSVAHDSHNIIAVGVDDQSILMAINKLIDTKGGIAAVDGDKVSVLELPVAGLMSMEEGETVARQYQQMNDIAKHLGSPLKAPFMTLSFLSLLVIPSLKLGDKGLFDVNSFSFTSLFE
jgi:adenine deaminase